MSNWYLKLLIYSFTALNYVIQCVVDVNLAEYEYLANHLGVEECRELIVLLHEQGFDKPSNRKLAKEKQLVPQEMGCLQMLLHWNSAQGEGLGKTHVELGHRLIQIGRKDLSQWLSQTVFNQLSQDIQKNLNKDILQPDENSDKDILTDEEEEEYGDEHWCTIDTVILVSVVSLTAAILLVGIRIIVGILAFKRTVHNIVIVESDPLKQPLLQEQTQHDEEIKCDNKHKA